MKRSTKIALGVAGAAVVVGGIGYVATRPPKPTKKKKNGDGVPKFQIAKITVPIWNRSMQPRAKALAEEVVAEMGNPEWSNEVNLQVAQKVAERMYPKAKLTTDGGWPSNFRTSSDWIEEGGMTKPEWQGAQAWRNIWFISASALGYVPVT